MEEPDNFNRYARAAALWTRDRLTDENRSFLLALPRERRIRDFFLFHGSIHDTDRYILYRDDAVNNFHLLAGQPGPLSLGFFGHTHVKMALIESRGVLSTSLELEELELFPDKRYLINPGSAGQPRDGDPRAAFLIYDDKDRKVTFQRVEYDILTCQEKIIRAGLPPQLAERLAWGR
jgi:diadenosine tetraphosphatase ApaH/serine/threonine PP2A family protein phosphatase